MDRALLVADEHVLDFLLLEELVVDVEDRAARIAEDVFDAFFLEAADDDFSAGELHGHCPHLPNREFAKPALAFATRGLLWTSVARDMGKRALQRMDRV